MADVPAQVNYGFITGRFVQFLADTSDLADVPDEVPLEGTATLTPTVSLMRFATTTPPRTAIISKIVCKIVAGNLVAPDGSTKLSVIASDQPAGDPNHLQWNVDIRLEGVTTQPAPITIEVPTNATIDLTTVIPSPPEPPAIIVVSSEDRELAEQAAADAALSAEQAEQAASTAADDAAADVLVQTGADVAAAQAAATAAQAAQAATPKWWTGTQAQYDALLFKDPATLYLITP